MGGFVKGATNWIEGALELNPDKFIRGGLDMMSYSAFNLAGKYDKKKQATRAVAAGLEAEKVSSLGKRKALYGTSGGVLGQEVEEVGKDYRGNIFGN